MKANKSAFCSAVDLSEFKPAGSKAAGDGGVERFVIQAVIYTAICVFGIMPIVGAARVMSL